MSTLSTQLPWSHFMEVLPIKDELAREFYITMAASQQRSIRRLRGQIEAMLYERTVISRKGDDFVKAEFAKLRDDKQLSPEVDSFLKIFFAMTFCDIYIVYFCAVIRIEGI